MVGHLSASIEVMVAGAVHHVLGGCVQYGHHVFEHPSRYVRAVHFSVERTVLHTDDAVHGGVGIGGVHHVAYPLQLLAGGTVAVDANPQHASCLIGIIVCCSGIKSFICRLSVWCIMSVVEAHVRVSVSVMVAHNGLDGQAAHDRTVLETVNVFILLQRTLVHLVTHVHDEGYVLFNGFLAVFFIKFPLCHTKHPFIV